MKDAALLRRMREGDEQAFCEFIELWAGYVAAIIQNLGHFSREDTEELSADVFHSIWKAKASIREGHVKAYLAKTARNAAISQLRRSRGEHLPLEEEILLLPDTDAPDELAIMREQKQMINQAVDDMGEPDREIFLRFYFFGEAIHPIAQRLHLNESTIKTKLHRARKKIRQHFEERGYRYEG